MSSVLYLYDAVICHHRTAVVVFYRYNGITAQHIKRRYRFGGLLYKVEPLCDKFTHLGKYRRLKCKYLIVCAEYLVFYLLKLIGNVSLAVCERLLSYISVGHHRHVAL